PIMSPSVPGIRLFRALARLLEARGVRIELNMEVICFHAEQHGEGRPIRWVETATSARPLRHYAREFALATGGVLGGGFVGEMSGALRETIFGLPLRAPQARTAWFDPDFFAPGGQPILEGGVR